MESYDANFYGMILLVFAGVLFMFVVAVWAPEIKAILDSIAESDFWKYSFKAGLLVVWVCLIGIGIILLAYAKALERKR